MSEGAQPDPEFRRCVGIMLLNAPKQAFVGRRINLAADAWQMPQGGIEAGEEPAAAAMRELSEEVGTDKAEIIGETEGWLEYAFPPEIAASLWRGRYRGQTQKWFAMRYLGDDSDIDLAGHQPEFDAWRWVAPTELPELIVAFKRPVYEAVLAAFGHLLAD